MKSKKIIAGVMAVALIFGSAVVLPTTNLTKGLMISASAGGGWWDYTEDEYGYSIKDDGTVKIQYWGEADENSDGTKSIGIPSQISVFSEDVDNYVQVDVTEIGGLGIYKDPLKVTIYDGITAIADEAFTGCENLKYIIIPDSVKSIGNKAVGYVMDTNTFEINKKDNFIIYCYKDSAAEQYAIDNGFTYKYIEKQLDEILWENKMNYNDALSFIRSYKGGIFANTFNYDENDIKSLSWLIYKNISDEEYDDVIIDSIYVKESNGFLYVENDGYAIICGYAGEKTNITIPETIDGLTVKKLSVTFSCGSCQYYEDGTLMGGAGNVTANFSFENPNVSSAKNINIYIPETVEEIGNVYNLDGGDIWLDFCFRSNANINISYASGSAVEAFCNKYGDYIRTESTWGGDAGSVTYGVGTPFTDNTDSELEYKNVKDGIEITDNTITSDTVKIPESIDGKNVVSVGGWAFAGMEITSVELPSVLKSIGEYAFFNCPALTSITVPKNVENIGDYALGYYLDENAVSGSSTVTLAGAMSIDTNKIKKIDGFKIYCYAGTAGEKYAVDNGFDYVLLDNSDSDTTTSSKSEATSTSNKTNNSSTANPSTGAAAGLALAAVGLGAVVAAKRRK